MESSETARILGNLEGRFTGIHESVSQILTDLKEVRKELMQVQVVVLTKIEQHSEQDDKVFSEIRSGLGGLRDRIVGTERVSDAVESHETAILDLEQRLKRSEDSTIARVAVARTNRRWKHGLIGLAGALSGGLSVHSMPKLWKWLGSFFAH